MAEERKEARSFEMLGRAIRVLRTEMGMNRKELAEAAGISYPYLTEIEAGKKSPSTSVLSEIAAVFSMQPHELLARADALAGRESASRGRKRGWGKRLERRAERSALMEDHAPALHAYDAAGRMDFLLSTPGAEELSGSERRSGERRDAILRTQLASIAQELEADDLQRLLDLAVRMVR